MLVIQAPRWLAHLAWSPDGKSIAGGCADASVQVWDAHSGALQHSLKGHSSTPSLVAFSHSGRLIASTARDNTVRLWDARSGNALVCLASHCSEPGLRFSRDDRRLSLSAYGTSVGVLEIAFDEVFQTIPARSGSGTSADFGRMTSLLNGRVLAVASSLGLRLYDLDRKCELAFIPIAGHELTVAATARGDGFFLCGGEDGFRRWTLRAQSDESLTLKPGTMTPARKGDAVTGVSVEDRLIAFASQSRGALTLLREEKNPLEVLGHDGIWQAVPSPDGRFVATGYFSNHHPERENVRVADAATGTQLAELPTGTSSSAAFSPDGRWLAAGGNARSGLWRTSDWHLAVEFKQEALNPEFAARSDFLAAVSDPDVSILRVPDGMNLGHLKCPENPTLRLCAGAGRLIMMAADSTTFVWDLRALRRELRAAGLDWDLPALPDAEDAARGELRVVTDVSNAP
jgi:WD40 repeat protein